MVAHIVDRMTTWRFCGGRIGLIHVQLGIVQAPAMALSPMRLRCGRHVSCAIPNS